MGVLSDTKRILNVPTDYPYFDEEILLHMNSILITAYQLGFTKSSGEVITSESKWSDHFLLPIIESVKQWFAFKVRLVWDPPQGSALEAIKSAVDELEWRLVAQLELSTLVEGGVQT